MKKHGKSRLNPLPQALFMATVVLVLSACSGQQNHPGNQENQVWGGRGMDKASRAQFWSRVKPLSNLAQAHYKLGRYYQKRGKHGFALEEFTKAIEVAPAYVAAYNAMGISYDALRDCEAAKKVYAQALRLSPGLAYLHNNLGYSRLLCNDPTQAVTHFSRAAELDTNTPRIQNNLLLARVRSREAYSTSSKNVDSVTKTTVAGADGLDSHSAGAEASFASSQAPVLKATSPAKVRVSVMPRIKLKETTTATRVRIARRAFIAVAPPAAPVEIAMIPDDALAQMRP